MEVSRQVLEIGGQHFGYDPAALRHIPHGSGADGAVYEYMEGGAGYIVKFMPAEADRVVRVQEIIAFVDYLRANGVPTPRLLPSASGNLLETAAEDGQLYTVTQAEKAPGGPVDFRRDWGPRLWEQWGGILGRIHALSTTYDGVPHIDGWEEEHASFASWCQDEPVGERWEALGETLRALPQPPDAYGLIHNDAHIYNFLVDRGRLTILDFDVCHRHWFTLDIAIALFHPLWEQRYLSPAKYTAFARRFTRAWLKGYRQQYALDAEWLDHLPLFARYRQMLAYIVMTKDGIDPTDQWAVRTAPAFRRAILADAPLPGLDQVTGWPDG